jgi:hypothetical protein
MLYGRWTSYAYMKKTRKPLAIALNEVGRGLRGETMGAM